MDPITIGMLISSIFGAGASLFGGYKADQANQQANAATQRQQVLIQQLMSGITPDAYRAQAAQAGEGALSQLAANFAGRGMLSSGALHTAGANLAGQLQTDANAKHQQDRMAAYQMAMGGQQAIQGQYARQVNPDPFAGVGQSLGAIGLAGGDYLARRYGQPAGSTITQTTPLPGFGVSYPQSRGY
ncbi:hypothetical protein [Deinococcus sp. QL22]|uniref:hypothetical protein n=1 Tax=Deinococcus sp. QL22 TaxID=2939437 RepID=UPI002016E522|nr:hypothetical protein [Deinococcus sp. QL22]UQN10828.1 hypothetical protein M1R55_31665 [Deinococcus sp. QL22]